VHFEEQKNYLEFIKHSNLVRFGHLAVMVEMIPDEESSYGHAKLLVCPLHTPVPAVSGKLSNWF
jgi:hypothetical protein